MSKDTQQDQNGVPVVVAPDDAVHPFPDGVPVAVPHDVPEVNSGSKSGQKAATQKKES